MSDIDKVIKGLDHCVGYSNSCFECPYSEDGYSASVHCKVQVDRDALELLKEMDSRIKKYEYLFDFLGIGFREWATKIIDGEAEAICEVDEHKMETIIRFKLI